MSRIIAVFNQAGGVAKTTLTQNLGYQLAQLGERVLWGRGNNLLVEWPKLSSLPPALLQFLTSKELVF